MRNICTTALAAVLLIGAEAGPLRADGTDLFPNATGKEAPKPNREQPRVSSPKSTPPAASMPTPAKTPATPAETPPAAKTPATVTPPTTDLRERGLST